MPNSQDTGIDIPTAIGVAVIAAPILGAIHLAQKEKKHGCYKLEAELEETLPGIVIGECDFVSFTDKRPEQVDYQLNVTVPKTNSVPAPRRE